MKREIVEAVRDSVGSPGRFPTEDCERVARAVLAAAVGALSSDEIDEHVRLSATGIPVFIEWRDLLAQLTGEAPGGAGDGL